MSLRLALTTLAALACACKQPPRPASEPRGVESTTLAPIFAGALAKANGTAARDDTVALGDHALTLSTVVVQEATRPDDAAVIGVQVTCALDGAPVAAFTSGGVGLGPTRADAVVAAADEWAQQYGAPIAAALAGRPPPGRVAGFAIYNGPVGIRGPTPGGLGDFAPRLIGTLEPKLATLVPPTPGFHSLRILVTRQPDGAVESESLVDAEDSPALTAALASMNWPESDQPYMLTQFYVLIRR